MAWVQITDFTLYPCDMCIGQTDFTPYTLQRFKYGIEKGKYKIEYVSGAVRSNNFQRYEKYLLSGITYERKWNKYYDSLQLDLSQLDFDYSPLPQIKLNVFQCQYGTLPGFTKKGTATKALAEHYGSKQFITTDIYDRISEEIAPLEFEVLQQSNISFWYTDDCAPCVEGNITYRLYQNIESSTIPINGLSVISFHIHSLDVHTSQYYKLQVKDATTISAPYMYQQNIIAYNSNRQYIKSLKSYNMIGYNSNKDNIYLTYKNNYQSTKNEDIFWQIKKLKSANKYNLITEMSTGGTNIPLFRGTYTIIIHWPKTNKLMNYQYINTSTANNTTESNNDTNIDIQIIDIFINDITKEYVLTLTNAAIVNFFMPCQIYTYDDSENLVFFDKIIRANTYFTLNEGIYKIINMKYHLITYGQTDIILDEKIKQYTFLLNQTSLVNFGIPGYLYSGIINGDQLISNSSINNQQVPSDISENNQLIEKYKDINYINADFYLYITNEYIQIVNRNITNKLINNLYGPFNSIEQAQKALILYCISNSLDYEKASDMIYIIGQK